MRYFVNTEVPSANPPFLANISEGFGQVIFWAIVIIVGLAYRWLRKHWTTPSERTFAIIGVCVIAVIILHFVFVEHGFTKSFRWNPSPSRAWFGWVGDLYPESPTTWFAPRFTAIPYGEELCFTFGIIAPFVLLIAAVFLLCRAVGRGNKSEKKAKAVADGPVKTRD